MLRMRTLLLATICISVFQELKGQYHYNAWFRSTLSIPAGNKLKIDTEVQHRRQNGFANKDMFDKNLMFTLRSWIHYQHNKDIKLSFSPFASFFHYRIIQNKTDEGTPPNNETRFSAAVELQHEIFQNFYIIDRNAFEYRMFGDSHPDITRLRTRFGVLYNFTDKLKLTMFDELFFNVTGTPAEHVFDHDRIGITFEYRIFPSMKLDIGYIHLTRLPIVPVTGDSKLKENNIIFNLIYQLKKREKFTQK